MHYTSIHIQNYKSFLNTGEIKLSKGINLIIGQNNVGKTAFLELLSGSIDLKPHLNKEQKPRATSKIGYSSYGAELEINISSQALEVLIEDKSFDNTFVFHNILIGYPNLRYITAKEYAAEWQYLLADSDYGINYDGDELLLVIDDENRMSSQVDFEDLINYLESIITDNIVIHYSIPNKISYIRDIYDEENITSARSGNIKSVCLKKGQEIKFREISSDYEISEIAIKEFFENRIYKFDIHRTVASVRVGTSTNKLEPNCSNLSSVLDSLQANPYKFAEYKELVKEVFPMIRNITIDNKSNSVIRIWLPQSEERPDLTVSLDDCGTGVGQVLAMLYVIVSSEVPKVIIIDEPNSFLHPSASRKLVEIFKKYDQHQYIISTHSPELIAASDADQILLLTLNEQGQTQVREIDKTKSNEMRDILENIGSKLSDVFGYESILWVEGPTEESCFSLIVEKLLKKSLTQQAILKVHDTGSFEKKHIKATLDLYNRLEKGNALIPQASAFIFDRENRNQKDIEDLIREGERQEEKEGKSKIHFLKRRLYENYLLNSTAITSILNIYSVEFEWENEFTEIEINTFLHSKKEEKKYWDNKKPTSDNLANWINEIHAAKLLEDLFRHFSKSRLEYRKTTHSKALTEWLIDNIPQELDELKSLLSKFY